jgi:hypothetical protein
MCVGRPCGAYAHGAWLAELLVQIQMLSNDLFGGLVLQSQLFGNPASVVVVDCETVNSANSHSVQHNGIRTESSNDGEPTEKGARLRPQQARRKGKSS